MHAHAYLHTNINLGAPEGTKGISLFLVPKRLIDADGDSAELNQVKVSRIEEKMGCHGSPTCQMEFEGAKGWLIGTENRGLNHMFTFINTSRVGTAVQGVAAAEAAFQNSLWYAKERKSMRALSGVKVPEAMAILTMTILTMAVLTMAILPMAGARGGCGPDHMAALCAYDAPHPEGGGRGRQVDGARVC